MDDKLVLKNRLAEVRAEQGISQAKLAQMVGVSRNTISSIETGQFCPTAKLALILCIALEKDFEEFYTDNETLVMDKFESLGIIKNEVSYDENMLNYFTKTIDSMRKKGDWTRGELIDLFNKMIPNFNHKETGKFLDGRM